MNESDILRPMFSYSLALIIFIIVLIGFIIFLLKRKPKPKVVVVAPVVIKPEVKNIWTIKDKYRAQIAELKQNLEQNKISSRRGYQRLSTIIRNFIFEMTQIKVQNYSLEEIKAVNMPVLTSLVEEYYDPEFAKDSSGDVLDALERTRLVIERWT